jgi:murein DD-endopeptidase MepM/ murein hydrolase activator NlpD
MRSGSLNDNDAPPVASSDPDGRYGGGASSVQVAALPDAGSSRPQMSDRPAATPSYQAPGYSAPGYQAKPFDRFRHPVTGAQAPAPHAPIAAPAKGEMITVQPGDTLYGLSKRHRVSLTELTEVNSLGNPNLKPGQKLYLPASSGVAAERAVEAATPAPMPLAPPSRELAAHYGASYTVKPGESLYTIARSHKVKFAELQQVNGISDPRRVKPGTVLKVPGEGGGEADVASAARPSTLRSGSAGSARSDVASNGPTVPPLSPSDTSSGSSQPGRYGQATTTQPTVINRERRVAELDTKANDASPDVAPVTPTPPGQKVAIAAPTGVPDVTDSVKLRWPASGRIIAGFGGRPDGTHNDGVNLSVPLGTEVHAAETGVVAYAGSELKGYGNLVLLRHDNGWVTAYAHNDELLVKRGDKVKRGQVIAKAGKTGSVDQPQVHFELRQGSKPVDPIPYLEKL